MKSLLSCLIASMVSYSITAQIIPDTITIKEPFKHESPDYNLRTSNLNTNENQPVNVVAEPAKYNRITVKLISKKDNLPIKNGNVFSKPVAEKIDTDLTDENGVGILELIPGKYRIYGQANGYQSRYKDIGHREDSEIVFILNLLDSLKGKLEHLAELIKARQIEEAKEYLKEIELLYPDNPDIKFFCKENNLK